MKYYDDSIVLALTTMVGRLVEVNIRNIDALRGKFTKVCVEINLSQTMVGKVWSESVGH